MMGNRRVTTSRNHRRVTTSRNHRRVTTSRNHLAPPLPQQNMMGNRFMGFFEAQITSWKGKLSGVRSVLEAWMEVQRQWCSLEAIFIG